MSARLTLTLFFIAILIFTGCKKENELKPVDYLYSYFPLIKGHELIYNVVDIVIDKDINQFDTVIYQLKERIDSMFIDNSGNAAWRLERYKRDDSTASWVISDVWMAQIANNRAQQVEENQRYVKIIFPPEIGDTWNGNIYTTLESQEYKVTGLNSPLSLNNFYFDSVLTVTTENTETMINKYYSFNQYANHSGLINKQMISIDYADIIPGLPIEQRISRGHLYYQTLIKEQIIL